MLTQEQLFPTRWVIRGVSREILAKHLHMLWRTHGLDTAKECQRHAHWVGVYPVQKNFIRLKLNETEDPAYYYCELNKEFEICHDGLVKYFPDIGDKATLHYSRTEKEGYIHIKGQGIYALTINGKDCFEQILSNTLIHLKLITSVKPWHNQNWEIWIRIEND